jgi:alpha-1,2-mannosyltransferase
MTTATLTQKDRTPMAPAAAGDGMQPGARSWVDGNWLDRRRLAIGAALLLAFELGMLAFLVAGTHGWIVPLNQPTTTDFISFYAAGALANAGTPALAYDHAAHLAAEELVVGAGIGYQYFNYPPVFMLLCAALAPLPYLVAFVLFEGGTLLFYLLVARRILTDRGTAALIVLLAFPIVFWNFGLGQNAFLTAALFGAATLLVDRRPVVAGLLFGALCYKPQFGLMIPLALAVGGHWRVFAAAAASAAALVLASIAVFGVETWSAFVATATASPEMYQSGRILFAGMANVFGGTRVLGAESTLAYGLQAVATVSAGIIVVAAWRRQLSLPTRAAALAAATVVAAPLVLLYDLMLAAVAAAWLVRDRNSPAASAWEMVLLAVIYLVLLDGRTLAEEWHVPIFPLAAIGVLAIAAGRAWRELALDRAAADYGGSRISSRS